MVKTDILTGLSSIEAAQRLIEYGPNAVADTAVHPFSIVLSKFWAPVPWMLEAAIVVQLVLHEFIEASVIAALLVFNALLGFFQESRAQETIAGLKSRLALNATVRRDGIWKAILAADLVPGDIIKLSLGAVVAADVDIIQGEILVDVSMLTGESMPVEAAAGTQTYAGALVRRGEAMAQVTATGTHTKFGRTAELVRDAHVVSSQQKAVLQIVKNLALFNGIVTVAMLAGAFAFKMPVHEIIPLFLTTILASIPVALPASFTLATAIGARSLAKLGVLPTRLSAVDEAATMDVLCSDKTGTLTRNELTVNAVYAEPEFDENQVLSMAVMASSEGGRDPIDAAIRLTADSKKIITQSTLLKYIPFDPNNKMSEALVKDIHGQELRIVKGAFSVVSALTKPSADASKAEKELEAKGFRVLAVAAGDPQTMRFVGILALSDVPRDDARDLIKHLHDLGVSIIMLTGDAPQTAATIAKSVGLEGTVCPSAKFPEGLHPEDCAVFAGILPEDKYHLVQAYQKGGHVVGMCGDGANDAPALRQAQIGIAVSTATDVAKSAAGMVLTEPGLGGIISAVKTGRIAYQRILTYTLRTISGKVVGVMFLAIGLIMTGHAILTPMLMVILMITGDFLAMSATTDNVRPSAKPDEWKIKSFTYAGIMIGACGLVFSTAVLAIGKFSMGMGIDSLRTLAFVVRVFNNQSMFYVLRERHHLWSSPPGRWVVASSFVDISIAVVLSVWGIAMSSLSFIVVFETLIASIFFAFIVDFFKVPLFRFLKIS